MNSSACQVRQMLLRRGVKMNEIATYLPAPLNCRKIRSAFLW